MASAEAPPDVTATQGTTPEGSAAKGSAAKGSAEAAPTKGTQATEGTHTARG